jgi:methanogenic corrinoid protein MtbC1
VTAEFAREIGADAYAPDAGSAVAVAKAALAR